MILVFISSTLTIQSQDRLLFQQNNELIEFSSYKKTKQVIEDDENPFYYKGTNITHNSKEIELEVEPDKRFIRAIQSPENEHVWYYCESYFYTSKYEVYSYNKVTKEKALVFNNEDTPEKNLIFLPFAFGAKSNTMYFNAFNIETLEENLGIWKLDLEKLAFSKIDIGDQYMSEPIISSDGKSLIFTESKQQRELIHGLAENLVSYDLVKRKKSTLYDTNGKQLNLLGFAKASGKKNFKQLGCEDESLNSSVIYNLPFSAGEKWCITRDGTNRPCPSSITDFCPQVHSGQHSYRALDIAHGDWAENNVNRNILSSADGKVVMAGPKGSCGAGYGLSVMVEHADGYLTLYAHLSETSVSVGQQVSRGQIIGKEGGSGLYADCSVNYSRYARHLHFETRLTIYGESAKYVKFSDIGGQTPRQNDVVIRTSNSPINPATCDAVPNIYASNISQNSCSLNWGAVSGALSYSLWYWSDQWVKFADISGTGASITGLVPSSTYYLSVTANCGSIVSPITTWAQVNTPNYRLSDGLSNSHLEIAAFEGNQIETSVDNTMKVYPNPAQNKATVEFELATENYLDIIVTDAIGRAVITLEGENKSKGKHFEKLETGHLPEGIYFCKIEAGDFVKIQKLMVVK